jgi:hypothetical protein
MGEPCGQDVLNIQIRNLIIFETYYESESRGRRKDSEECTDSGGDSRLQSSTSSRVRGKSKTWSLKNPKLGVLKTNSKTREVSVRRRWACTFEPERR